MAHALSPPALKPATARQSLAPPNLGSPPTRCLPSAYANMNVLQVPGVGIHVAGQSYASLSMYKYMHVSHVSIRRDVRMYVLTKPLPTLSSPPRSPASTTEHIYVQRYSKPTPPPPVFTALTQKHKAFLPNPDHYCAFLPTPQTPFPQKPLPLPDHQTVSNFASTSKKQHDTFPSGLSRQNSLYKHYPLPLAFWW